MTKVVYKFKLALSDQPTVLSLPEGSVPLATLVQHGDVVLYVLIPIDPTPELEHQRVFQVFGTGHDIEPVHEARYISSCADPRGYVWHVFEMVKENAPARWVAP